jgi:hypothetical protein
MKYEYILKKVKLKLFIWEATLRCHFHVAGELRTSFWSLAITKLRDGSQ